MRHSFRRGSKPGGGEVRYGERPDVDKHAQRCPGDRRLPDPREGALRVRAVRPRQHPVHRRALRASSEIKTISVHHETVAGFMADVYYRVSGQPTATFTSCGPGSANLPIALGNSFLDSVPFLAVTGNVPTSQFNRGAFQELYRHYQADFPSTVRAYCKRVFQPTRGEMVPLAVRQAWKTMVTGRPGPVVLDVPFDVFPRGGGRRKRRGPKEWSANISCRCGADPEGVVKAVDMLLARRAPGHSGRAGRQLWRRRGRSARARRKACEIPVASSASGLGAHRCLPSARARPRRAQRTLSGEPCDPPGGCAAGARRALRRPHLELLAARLFLHDSADPAHPRRHRSGRDRPQLSGRARPDGGRAHFPAPDARRAGRRARTQASAPRRGRRWLRRDRRLSQGMGRVRRARLCRRCLADQSAARRPRDRQGAAATMRSSSATSASITTG